MAWYPDSGVTHHVCKDASTLKETTHYSGITLILMGDGTPAKINCVGNTSLLTRDKVLRLSNVLLVPNIRKNLMFDSQLALENNVFFEFHSSYCVIKDTQTWQILL